ncbi:MAG: hypothetical protein HMLKMBBP_01271 [Planctomycetes bacterium]|nr:hypothetical protein [Planctomycetota bacterium]
MIITGSGSANAPPQSRSMAGFHGASRRPSMRGMYRDAACSRCDASSRIPSRRRRMSSSVRSKGRWTGCRGTFATRRDAPGAAAVSVAR